MWNVIFSVSSAVLALLCAITAVFAARRAARAAASPPERVHYVESKLQLIERSVNDQQEVLTELANRVKMMKVRSAVRHGSNSDELPDPYKDPDGWRKAMNSRMAQAKIGANS